MLRIDIYSAAKLGNIGRRADRELVWRMYAEQLKLRLFGGRCFAIEVANSEDLDALTFLGLHDNDGQLLLTAPDQIGELGNDDIERLAEGNAIGPKHENRVALGDIFIGCRAP